MKIFTAIILAGALGVPGLQAQQYVISTFAGGGFPLAPATATNFTIGNPLNLTTDGAGNVYFASLNCAFSLDANGVLNRLAGTSAGGYSGDGASALTAKLFAPGGVAVDGTGSLYIADTSNSRIRKVSPNGTIVTVAGNGTRGFAGDSGPAVAAELNNPTAVALDGAGNLYIFDSSNLRIRKISTSGIITTVATGIAAGHGLAADKAGNLYFAETANQRVRKVATDGTITTIAGITPLTPGSGGVTTGDGGPATQAQLNLPSDVALDTAGNIYISEATRVRVISGGTINSVPGATGPSNDPFLGINGITVDASGNIFVADTTSRIRKITPTGVVSIVAGPSGVVTSQANFPATSETFSGPTAVAPDSQGNVLIADTGGSWLWRVLPAGTIVLAGHPTKPSAVAVDSKGNYYVASQNEVVEANYAGSTPPTPAIVAGGGNNTGDGGLATSALLKVISGLAVDASGNFYIADMIDQRIRKVTPAGIITTIAGTGTSGFSGDNGPAANAQISLPRGIALDNAGNLYIADTGNFRIREISAATGIITTVAGGGTVFGDGGPATSAILDFPTGVAVDSSNNIYIVDPSYSRVRKVTTDGVINTIAGNGSQGYYGDGGLATAAALNQPTGIAVDNAGNVYVAEQGNNIVRMLKPTNAPVLISAVFDAANEQATAVTPGKIVVIYGSGMGPASVTVNAPSAGAFGTNVAGTSVTFNGVAAPMIYSSATQLSAIVPYEMTGATTAQVVVTSQSGVSSAFPVSVAASAPSFFSNNGTGAGQIAAVNLSGIVNDAANPVPIGGYISLYATGEGQTSPAGIDGALANVVYPKPLLNVTVNVGGIPVIPTYAGAAPTEVLGLMQIVVQIPAGVQPGGYVPVQLQVGTNSTVSNAAWIAVSAN